MEDRRYNLLIPVRAVSLIITVFMPTIALCLWMTLFLPLLWLWPEVYFLLSNHFRNMASGIAAVHWWMIGCQIVEVGNVVDDILPDKSILMMNHQSLHDGPMMFAELGKRGLAHHLGHLSDHWFKFTTHYGYHSMFGRDVFVNQLVSEGKRKAQLARITRDVASLFKSPSRRTWFLLFPEGGLLYKRRPKSQAYAKRNGFPVLQHVALPRMGGMEAIVKAFTQTFVISKSENDPTNKDNQWKWIVDATIAYPGGKALSLSDVVTCELSPCLITICYRIFPASEVPLDTDRMQKWLFERFVEKEAMLEYFYEHGRFPEDYFTRNHDRPVRNRPQPTSWNCYIAGLAYVTISAMEVWSAVMVWRFIMDFMYNIIIQIFCILW